MLEKTRLRVRASFSSPSSRSIFLPHLWHTFWSYPLAKNIVSVVPSGPSAVRFSSLHILINLVSPYCFFTYPRCLSCLASVILHRCHHTWFGILPIRDFSNIDLNSFISADRVVYFVLVVTVRDSLLHMYQYDPKCYIQSEIITAYGDNSHVLQWHYLLSHFTFYFKVIYCWGEGYHEQKYDV